MRVYKVSVAVAMLRPRPLRARSAVSKAIKRDDDVCGYMPDVKEKDFRKR